MSGVELVVLVVLAFFTIGIVVGVIAVIAMSAIRHDQIDRRYGGRRGGLGPRAGRRAGTRPGDEIDSGEVGWTEPPEAFGPDTGDDDDEGPPRWPGGSAA